MMARLFASLWFKYLVLPIFVTFLTMFLKLSSRRDEELNLTLDDCAIGLDLCMSTIFAFLVDTVVAAQDVIDKARASAAANDPSSFKAATEALVQSQGWLMTAMGLLALMLIGVFGLAFIVRKFGWEKGSDGHFEPDWIFGIALPLLVSIIFMTVTVVWMNGP